jgi:uncharacterized protein YfaS (alpha-2-macroglobulin family)
MSTSKVPAGRRRFWITVLAFAVANAGAWVVYDRVERSRAPRRDILAVQRFTPGEGEIVRTRSGGTAASDFTWTFNLDVGVPGPLVRAEGKTEPVTFSPAIRGDFRWKDARTLAFVPAGPLPKATKFTATVNPAGLAAAEGYTLSSPVTTTFKTTPLQVNDARQVAYDTEDRVLVELSFNDTVNPSEVLAHLEVRDEAGRPVTAALNGKAPGETVRVLVGPLKEASVVISPPAGGQPRGGGSTERVLHVTIAPGLVGASGPLGLAEAEEQTISVARVLMASAVRASAPSVDRTGELTLTFNNPLPANAVDLLSPLISVEPQVPVKLGLMYSGTGMVLRGDFVPGTRYTVKIAKPATGDDPQKYPRPATLSAFVPDYRPTADFAMDAGYLGSKGNRTVKATAVNVPGLVVQAYRVYENNLVTWRNGGSSADWEVDRYAKPVATRRITLSGKKNEPQEVRINLDELLGTEANDGAYRLVLSRAAASGREEEDGREESATLVSLSDVGLTAKVMRDEKNPAAQAVMVWAVSLSSAQPAAGAKIRLFSNKNQLLGEAVADESGIARIDGIVPAEGEEPALVVAGGSGQGGGPTWLDLSMSRRDSRADTGGREYLRTGYESFVYTDRGVYRPGEKVMVRAIVRGADLAAPPENLPLRVQLKRPDGRVWQSKTVAVDADGAIAWQPEFPSDAQTGYWSAMVTLPGDSRPLGSVHFQIEEFLPDRVKTVVTASGQGLEREENPHLKMPGTLTLAVQSDYLFGQPAAALKTEVKLRATPSSFRTKEGFVAGDTASAGEILANAKKPLPVVIAPPATTLDKAGHAEVEVDVAGRLGISEKKAENTSPYEFRGPWVLTATESTTEVSGRAVTATTSMTADALDYYVCARAAAGSHSVHTPMAFDVRLLSPDGKTVAERREIRAAVYRESWESHVVQERGRMRWESLRLLDAVQGAAGVVRAEGEQGHFEFTPTAAGRYVLELIDASSGQATTLPFFVGDDAGWADSMARENPEALEVNLQPEQVADAKGPVLFHPGENARAVVRSPFAGRLLLTVESDRVLWSQVVEMPANSAEVPVTLPADLPANAFLAATVVRAVEPNKELGEAWRTHRAFGVARFTVDPAVHRLEVKLAAASEMRPQRTLDVDVAVTDAAGKAQADTAVTLVAVDEGILRVTDFKTPDPIAYFLGQRALGVETADLYGKLMPEVAKVEGVARVGGDAEEAMRSSPVPAKRVKPVALVTEVVHTDESGLAHVHLQVPQFLGQLRVMAVAYRGATFGRGEAKTLVRSPLVVQSSFPRFLAPNDSATLPMLVINNSDAAGDVQLRLTVDAGDVLAVSDAQEPVHLGAHEQKLVRVKLAAKLAVGVGRLRLSAEMAGETFDETVEIPVRPPSPQVTRGETLVATPEKPVTISASKDLLEGTASMELRLSPRPQLSLPEALGFLDHYPYGCLEQTTSQCLPLVYLPDVGRQIAPDLFDQERVERKVQAGILRMLSMQTASGGLSMWPGEEQPWAYGSVYAAQFLVEAGRAGHPVPEDFRTSLLGYVRGLLADSPADGEELVVQAYAAHVLALVGKPNRAAMNRLAEILAADTSAPPAARLHLALAQAAGGQPEAAVALLPQDLPVLPKRELGRTLASPVQDQALLLTTMLTVNPDDPRIPGLAQKLAAGAGNPAADGWLTTHDNALAFLALGKYFRSTKDDAAFSAATLTRGDTLLATAKPGAPAQWSTKEAPDGELAVKVEGPPGAKAFVSWVQRGVPLAMPAAADHVLKVRREYLDEQDQPLPSLEIASGAAVKVRLTLETPSDLRNVVVEDLLPAGLEIENPRLVTAAKAESEDQQATEKKTMALSPNRLDMRDDRLVLVADLQAGASTFTYLARAVTTGTFVVPPVHAECMYDPGINSLADGGGKLVVTAGTKVMVQR